MDLLFFRLLILCVILSNCYAFLKGTVGLRCRTSMSLQKGNNYSLLLEGLTQDVTEAKYFSSQVNLLDAAVKLAVIIFYFILPFMHYSYLHLYVRGKT